MLHVGNKTINAKGMHNSKQDLLYVSKQVKMTTDSNQMFCGKNSVRDIWPYNPDYITCVMSGKQGNENLINTHSQVPDSRYTASPAQNWEGLVMSKLPKNWSMFPNISGV